MSAESQLLSVVRAAVNEWGRDRRCDVTALGFLCPGWKYPRYSRADTCQALEWLRRPLPMTSCLRSLAFFRGVRPRTVVGKLVGGGMATWRGLGHSLDRPAVSNPWFGQPSHVEGGCTAARSCLSVPLALYSTFLFLPFRCCVRVPPPVYDSVWIHILLVVGCFLVVVLVVLGGSLLLVVRPWQL